MRRWIFAALAAMSFMALSGAASAAIVLDFNGVANPSNSTTVGGYYDGGVSGDGNSGPNYGIAFTDNALAINSYNGCCNPDPGALYFLSGGAVTMDVAAGFTTGFSFVYASNSDAFINVYDGLDATGNLLATLSLTNNYQSGCGYCTWTPIGVSFSGTAHSIDFGGGANYVAYDDVTIGSASVGNVGVPEPATWMVAILGIFGIGFMLRRSRSLQPGGNELI